MTWEIAVGVFGIISAFIAVMNVVVKINSTLAKLESENASQKEIKRVLRKEIGGCIRYSLFFSLLTSAVVFILAELIGTKILLEHLKKLPLGL